jgi:hypothetical protein
MILLLNTPMKEKKEKIVEMPKLVGVQSLSRNAI